MHVSDIDLKLLRVFHAVVEADGFANAQGTLNISPSTISANMSQLEIRLGFKLCERGRSGFRLTPKGERFHRQVIEFFGAVHTLESSAASLRNDLSGPLRLGILDNLVSDPECPLHPALKQFMRTPRGDFQMSIDVLAPPELERALLENRIDIGIGISYHRTPGVSYRTLYRERDVLVCAKDHPLATVNDPRELASALPGARKIARNFMQKQEFPFIEANDQSITTVSNVEAAAFLILNGPFIGFLPRHYARQWITDGQLVALLPERFVRYSNVSLMHAERDMAADDIVVRFRECLLSARAPRSGDVAAPT